MNTGNPNIDNAAEAAKILTRQIMDTHDAWVREKEFRDAMGYGPDTAEQVVVARLPIDLARAAMNAIEHFVKFESGQPRQEGQRYFYCLDHRRGYGDPGGCPECAAPSREELREYLAEYSYCPIHEQIYLVDEGCPICETEKVAAPEKEPLARPYLEFQVERLTDAEHRRDRAIEQLRNELKDLAYRVDMISKHLNDVREKVFQR